MKNLPEVEEGGWVERRTYLRWRGGGGEENLPEVVGRRVERRTNLRWRGGVGEEN